MDKDNQTFILHSHNAFCICTLYILMYVVYAHVHFVMALQKVGGPAVLLVTTKTLYLTYCMIE